MLRNQFRVSELQPSFPQGTSSPLSDCQNAIKSCKITCSARAKHGEQIHDSILDSEVIDRDELKTTIGIK